MCKVTSSRQRDVMNRPLANGLYDARMGPTDNWDTCVTCGLEYGLCPSHFGHIDLPLPTYTHLLFPHNTYSTQIRKREMTKILGFVED